MPRSIISLLSVLRKMWMKNKYWGLWMYNAKKLTTVCLCRVIWLQVLLAASSTYKHKKLLELLSDMQNCKQSWMWVSAYILPFEYGLLMWTAEGTEILPLMIKLVVLHKFTFWLVLVQMMVVFWVFALYSKLCFVWHFSGMYWPLTSSEWVK